MILVDAMGDACPIPVVKTKKVLDSLREPETVEVLVDNEIAVQNVTRLGRSTDALVSSEKLEEGRYRITLQVKGGAPEKEDAPEEILCTPDLRGNTVVVLASDRMGEGDDELGRILIKSFLFALTQLDTLPKTLLFYNGGARLTTEGSASLEDLRTLESEGVEILTCGTCLDFYGLKDKLVVGGVTNMYQIAEIQMKASRLLRP